MPSLPPTHPKVMPLDAIEAAVAADRQAGLRIVATNGCFDVLHVGHLRYLQAARNEGDKLVVLINTDRSVRALKGPERPVVCEDDRAELLAGLSCVDYVALFDTDSPLSALLQIAPDSYAKGDEYATKFLPERADLEAAGTRIALIPMVPGRSTTSVVERIRHSGAEGPPACSPSTP